MRLKEAWLTLKVQLAPDRRSSPRFLLVIPKKVVRLATKRNRLKRLLRESLRTSALDPEKSYIFKVETFPGELKQPEVRITVGNLLNKK